MFVYLVIFDIIRFHFKCCSRVRVICLNIYSNYFSETHIIKVFIKICGKWIYTIILFNEFWLKLGGCFLKRLGIFWEAKCFQFGIEHLFVLFIKSFMLFVNFFFGEANHGFYFIIKDSFSQKRQRQGRNVGGFSKYGNFISRSRSRVSRQEHNKE